jgi:hypothetical protein
VVLPGVNPGGYSLCCVVIPGRLDDPARQYRVRTNAGAAHVRCQSVEVVDGAEQSVAVEPWAEGESVPTEETGFRRVAG